MRYWNRNLISATERRPTAAGSSGIFDLRSQSIYKNADAWPVNGELTTSGLFMHLDAGDSSSYSGSGTAWNDLTSNGLDFTLTNGPTYSSNFGGYISFDGVNDYASLSSGWQSFGTDPYSIEFWHRPHSFAEFESMISNTSGNTGTFQISYNSGGAIQHRDSSQDLTSDIRFNVNAWKQVVVVREGTGEGQFKFYENGSLNTTTTSTTDINSSDQIQIGRNRANDRYFDGDLAIIRIYRNKALNAAEVAGNYFYNVGRFV